MQETLTLSVIVPVYNEEAVIRETHRRLSKVLDSLNEPFEVIFVNDGSRDGTAALAAEICRNDGRFKLIDFSRNFGHQVAITAGMEHAAGEAVIVIDADLQDPPELIPEMLKKWREGYDVVYGKRCERKGESFFKKFTAGVFYRLLKKITDVDIPVDTGDFRLIGRNVCEALKQINERNRYVRGIIAWLGFRQTGIEFVRDKRFAGETKYPLKKMLKFAFDAISSFSYKPLKLASYIGFFISMVSFLYLIVVLYQGLFSTGTAPGWASTLAVSLFFNGIVLIILGIIGGYLGRIYDEAKGRPLYIIRQMTNFGLRVQPQESGVLPQEGHVLPQEGHVLPQEGHVLPQEGHVLTQAGSMEGSGGKIAAMEADGSADKIAAAEINEENSEDYDNTSERKLFKDKLKPSPG